MCGIVGLAGGTGPPLERARVERAAASIAARGPDDAGCWVSDGVALGHRRLAVIDLSPSGHQPMFSPDGRYAIVYNGELYNFRALRAELEGVFPRWQSQSDTEVILAAFARWGAACLERFRGMFAFGIWDARERSLFLARDRMGVKPLYYHAVANRIAFSSRPRALFELLPDLSREIDPQALRYYLECGYVPQPHSIHASVRKLEPAHWLLWRDGEVRIERYWDFRGIEPEAGWERRPEQDLLDELDELVSRAVASRLVSDVPLGAFLSGGIDSSLVVAMMARHSNAPVETFTIGFDDPRRDESPHALAVARHLGTNHHTERLEPDSLLDLIGTFREEFDEPFYDYSAFAALAVARSARKHVTVALSGDGGDELFGGYHYYLISNALAPFFRCPGGIRRGIGRLLARVPGHRARLFGGALQCESEVAAFAFSRSIAKDYESVLSLDVAMRTRGYAELLCEAAADFRPGLRMLETAMRLDTQFTLPEDYLQKVDVSSMAFSLEAREPLLDQDLVEWAMRVPLRWKVRSGVNKILLRKLAYRYVPREILDRPKQGFVVPLDRWLRGPLRGWAQERLNDPQLYQLLPLRQPVVQRLFELHDSGARNVASLLWAVLALLDFAGRSLRA